MSKKKLKQRIKELQAGNLALADINMGVCKDLKGLKTHHDKCMENMACEISEMRLKNESLSIANRNLESQIDRFSRDLYQAEKDEKANARFIAMVLRS